MLPSDMITTGTDTGYT